MSKKIINEYDKIITEWIHLYEGTDTAEIIALEEKMDDLWKRMSLDERQDYLLENKKRLEDAAAGVIIHDKVKSHE